ncbi:uncharacterized protein LOC114752217 [Neltuma alba]|uniref:uncharacterized protein LOC114752217 n=1 Tax=Neltuma alba TaxID=207710 RepID=UPI0010A38AA6|nr:uncharacterized protein LOC114752217 [Prosopis alba]
MSFLLEFASCCGCAASRSPVPATFSPSSSSYYYGEKRRSFVPRRPTHRPLPSFRPRHVLKRRRLAARAKWRPTLLPISEDDEVETQRCDSIRSEKQGMRRSDASRALHYDYDSRSAGASSSNIVTAFYPMPYMF